MWQARAEELMSERLKGLQGASAEKEYMCRKIVSLCTGVPVDKVEDMLENLVVAVESENTVVDIGRVSGFMQKVWIIFLPCDNMLSIAARFATESFNPDVKTIYSSLFQALFLYQIRCRLAVIDLLYLRTHLYIPKHEHFLTLLFS